MQHKHLLFSFALFLLWLGLSATRRDPSNPPVGVTGAPGEGTCGDCHSGGSQTGTVTLTGVPDTVISGKTYALTITNTSNASRAGFEMICLDGAQTMCGTFSAASGSGVSIGSGSSNKKYPRQSAAKTLSGGSTAWTFNWLAPATASGNKATFYFVTLCANGDGRTNGDRILMGNKVVNFGRSTTPTQAEIDRAAVRLYPTMLTEHAFTVELANTSTARLQVFDLNGRALRYATVQGTARVDMGDLPAGTYIVAVEVQGKMWSQKIVMR